MKFLSKNTLLILLASFGMAWLLMSCENDNILGQLGDAAEVSASDVADAVEDVAARGSKDSTRGHRDGCFDLVYPVTLSFPDGTTAVADSAEELFDLLRDWKIANGDSANGRPSLVFPVDVVLNDGSTQTVNTEEEFKRILADCGYGKKRKGKRGKKHDRARDCYELVFPITINFPDSTTATANDAEELHQLVRDWKANNPDSRQRPTFDFPFDVIVLSDSSTVTINDKADLDAIRDNCFRDGRGTRCNNDSTSVGP